VEPEQPDFRATVRNDRSVRLVDWGPWLATGGPLYALIEARGRAGVAIADLTVIRDDDEVAVELIVAFRCGGSSVHRQALCAWAGRVGYRRAWFEGEVRELDPVPGGAAHTRWTGCRARLVDADASFWEFVRHYGAFPAACVLCGSDLPQWSPVRQTPEAAGDPEATQTSRRTACR
jgi:hypothetical protein